MLIRIKFPKKSILNNALNLEETMKINTAHDDGNFLISVSWMTKQNMLRSLRNPEINMIDTARKTNRRNRLSVCVCSVDTENKNVRTVTALLCNKTRASFDFTLKSET